MNFRRSYSAARTAGSSDIPVVHVIDGDPQVREGLERLIRSSGWQPRVASTATEFLEQPPTAVPGCVLLELELPDMCGLTLQHRLSDRAELPLIFMSGRADVRTTVQAMKAGAFEFLLKPFVEEAVSHAIRSALERSGMALRQLAAIRAVQERYASLSRREREVLHLVTSGRLNKQVGGELGISEITVKAHRGRMMRKMQAGSLAELVYMVAALGGSPPEPRDVIVHHRPSIGSDQLPRMLQPAIASLNVA